MLVSQILNARHCTQLLAGNFHGSHWQTSCESKEGRIDRYHYPAQAYSLNNDLLSILITNDFSPNSPTTLPPVGALNISERYFLRETTSGTPQDQRQELKTFRLLQKLASIAFTILRLRRVPFRRASAFRNCSDKRTIPLSSSTLACCSLTESFE